MSRPTISPFIPLYPGILQANLRLLFLFNYTLLTILSLIEKDSRFAMRMLASLSMRMRNVVDDIESFSLQPPAARLITYLMRLLPSGAMTSATIELSINKNIVAAHLNLTPETLSRYFKTLTNLELVSLNGKTVLVHDIDRLGNYLNSQTNSGTAIS